MRILVVSNRRPDRQGAGDAMVAHWSLDALADAGHPVSLVELHRASVVRRSLGVLQAGITGQPLQIGLVYSTSTKHEVCERLMAFRPDVVIAIHARAAAHIPAWAKRRTLALLVDAYGRSYGTYAGRLPFLQDALFRLERARMEGFERSVAREFGGVAFVNADDVRYVRAAVPNAHLTLMSLPVDLAFFSQTERRPAPQSPCFGFLGRLSYLPNLDAVRHLVADIWPWVRKRCPAARLLVVGAQPSSSLRRFLAGRGVELAGDVSDVRKPMAEMTALLAPVRMGGGIQVKTLEAMAAGVPVVCSDFARRGISAEPGEHLLIAESPSEFAEHAARLIEEPGLADRLARAAQTWTAAHHAPQIFGRQLLDVCAAMAAGRT